VRVLGVDPDSTHTAWAIISGDDAQAVGVWKTKRSGAATTVRQLSMAMEEILGESFDLVVVEGQQYHHGNSTPAKDLIKLAQISGGIAGLFMAGPGSKVVIPEPFEWKKTVKKTIHQTRTYRGLGLLSQVGAGYAYPTGCAGLAKVRGAGALNMGDWKHVGDALGLAAYGSRLLRS